MTLSSSRRVIAAMYARDGKLALDVAVAVPWELVTQAVADGVITDTTAGGTEVAAYRAKVSRLLRLSVLLRMSRVATATGRVLGRLRDALGMTHATVTLATLLASCAMLSHWLACAYHLVAVAQPGTCSWVHAYFAHDGECAPAPNDPPLFVPVHSRYITALYFAVMTVTTVGYGDVPAQTDAERCLVIVGMLVGAITYAYVVGALCSLLTQMSEHKRALDASLDRATRLAGPQAEHSAAPLPPALLARVRGYLRYVDERGAAWGEDDMTALAACLPPGLRAEAQRARRGAALARCRLFAGAPPSALADLAAAVSVLALPPGELLTRAGARVGTLSLLRSGLVATWQASPARLRTVSVGDAFHARRAVLEHAGDSPKKLPATAMFGLEALWPDLTARHTTMALTYAELHVISRERLAALSERHVRLRASTRTFALGSLLRETLRQMGAAHVRARAVAAAHASSVSSLKWAAATALPSNGKIPETRVGTCVEDSCGRPIAPRRSRHSARAVMMAASGGVSCLLSHRLVHDVARSAAPDVWRHVQRSAVIIQRAVRRYLSRRQWRAAAAAAAAAAATAGHRAAPCSALAPGLPQQQESASNADADAAPAPDAATAALAAALAAAVLHQLSSQGAELRRVVIALGELADDLAALRRERRLSCT